MKNYRKYFLAAIGHHYPQQAEKLINATDSHFRHISKDTQFARSSKNPLDRRLEFSAYFLALIKTLDEQRETFETIRTICLEVVTEYVKPKNKVQAMLKRLPPKLINTWLATALLKVLRKKMQDNSSPQGFVASIITSKQETYGLGYGIDILECGICKLYNKHHSQKYAPILCEVDAITASLAGLKLIRSGTIANGAAKCDFRFVRE